MSNQSEYIDQFLRGELSDEEAARFKEQLETDPELREKVELHEQIVRGLQTGFNRELKEFLQNEETELSGGPVKSKTKRIPVFVPVGIAAAFALIIVSYFVINSSPDTEELFGEYYNVYPNIESPVSRSDAGDVNPFSAYEQANYQVALERFRKSLINDPTNAALHFYAGICHLELGNYAEAIQEFQSAKELQDPAFQQPADWYEALAHLRNGDLSKSKTILRELENGNDLYASKAQQLLKDL